MICPICKNSLSKTTKICPRCGKTIMEIPGYSIPEEKIVVHDEVPKIKKKNSKIKKYFEGKDPKSVSTGIIVLGLLFCFSTFCVKGIIKAGRDDYQSTNEKERLAESWYYDEDGEYYYHSDYDQRYEDDGYYYSTEQDWVNNDSSYWESVENTNDYTENNYSEISSEEEFTETYEPKSIFQDYEESDLEDGMYVISGNQEDRVIWIYTQTFESYTGNTSRRSINYVKLEDDAVATFLSRGKVDEVDHGQFSIKDVTNIGNGVVGVGQDFEFGFIDDNIVILDDEEEILAGTYKKRDDLILRVYGDYGEVYRNKGVYMWKSEPVEYLITEANIEEINKPENIGKFFYVEAEMKSGGDEKLNYIKGGYVLNLKTDTWSGTTFLGLGYIKEKRSIKDGTKVTFIGQYIGLTQDVSAVNVTTPDLAVFNTIDVIEAQE